MPELDNNALFTVTVDEQTRLETVNAIRKLIGDENSMSGSAVNTAVATQATNSEIKKIISYVYSAGAEVPMINTYSCGSIVVEILNSWCS